MASGRLFYPQNPKIQNIFHCLSQLWWLCLHSRLFHPSCLSSGCETSTSTPTPPITPKGNSYLKRFISATSLDETSSYCFLHKLQNTWFSVSLLQHKVHLSAHAAPPELLREAAWGKVTFLLGKTRLIKRLPSLEHISASDIWSRWATVTALQYGERTKSSFSQHLCFTTLSDLGTCKLAAIN